MSIAAIDDVLGPASGSSSGKPTTQRSSISIAGTTAQQHRHRTRSSSMAQPDAWGPTSAGKQRLKQRIPVRRPASHSRSRGPSSGQSHGPTPLHSVSEGAAGRTTSCRQSSAPGHSHPAPRPSCSARRRGSLSGPLQRCLITNTAHPLFPVQLARRPSSLAASAATGCRLNPSRVEREALSHGCYGTPLHSRPPRLSRARRQ